MRTSRAVMVAGGCAAIVGAGWAASPKEVPTLDLVAPASPTASPTAAGTATVATPSPTPSISCEADDSGDDADDDKDRAEDDDCVTVLVTPSPVESATDPGAADPAAGDGGAVTVDGPVVTNLRGDYQARITVDAGVVTAVDVLAAGTQDAQSVQINARAIPELAARVVAAQSWDVDHVSGASFTSPGFLESVRGAFADAGL